MGFVLSKFRRKKPSNKECLENLDKELRSISRFQVDTELQQKRIIGRLLIFSSVVYLLFAAVFYFLAPRGLKWKEQLLYALPFVVFPLLMWLIKRCISWYYDNKIVRNREKYNDLKKEKERLLDDVMENETFKVAKEILEKYAPSHLLPKYLAEQQRAVSMSPMPATPGPGYTNTPQSMAFQEGIRRRQMNMNLGRASLPFTARAQSQGMTPSMRPFTNQAMSPQLIPRAIMSSTPAVGPSGLPISPRLGGVAATPQPSYMLPLPPVNPVIQNHSRGWMDKLVDYVVGDGASHRYALICRYCATHNGLATPEDFPYTGFRCVFCRQFNPPRQVRPAAQRLPVNTVLIEEMDQTSTSTTLKEEGGPQSQEASLNLSKDAQGLQDNVNSSDERRANTNVEDYEEKRQPEELIEQRLEDNNDDGCDFNCTESINNIENDSQPSVLLSSPPLCANLGDQCTSLDSESCNEADVIKEILGESETPKLDKCASDFVFVEKNIADAESS